MNVLYFFLSYEVEAAQKAKNKPCFVDILLLPHQKHCSTLTVVHLSRTSETLCWASKKFLLAQHKVSLVLDKWTTVSVEQCFWVEQK